MANEVVRLQARAERWRLVDGGDDLHQAVLHGHLNPQAAKLAPGLDLHVLEALGVEIARMGIERAKHAVDRGLDQIGVGDILDILRSHALEHVAEQIELLIGVRGVRRDWHCQKRQTRCADPCDHYLADHPLTFRLPDASHVWGLMGWPL